MKTEYKILFEIKLQHEYFTSGNARDLIIVPTQQTKKIFGKHRLIFHQIKNSAIILIPVDSDDAAVLRPSGETKWTFYLQNESAGFSIYTDHPIKKVGKTCYFLHNINSNISSSGVLHLSKPIPRYDNTGDYHPGDKATDASNDIYVALKSNGKADRHTLSQNTYWQLTGKEPSVSKNDLIDVAGDFLEFKVSVPATSFDINVYSFDPATGDLSHLISHPQKLIFDALIDVVSVDLSQLPDGEYYVEVNGQGQTVYKASEVISGGSVGIIEIYNHLPASNPYALFSGNGKLKQPIFNIRFASRMVLWAYKTSFSEIQNIRDNSSGPVIFSKAGPGSKKHFVSSKPIPFQEIPARRLQLQSNLLGVVAPLPLPGLSPPVMIVKDNEQYLVIEKYLNI